jgi:hypothetical protein
MIFFKKKRVELGEGQVTQYTVFESKRLFSLIFYRWGTIDQVRFHTHAFGAVAFLLRGWYWEKVRFGGTTMTNFVNVPLVPRFLPRNYCHAIENSKPGTITMVIAGPWQKTWWEYFPKTDTWQQYGWGRVKLKKLVGQVPPEVSG